MKNKVSFSSSTAQLKYFQLFPSSQLFCWAVTIKITAINPLVCYPPPYPPFNVTESWWNSRALRTNHPSRNCGKMRFIYIFIHFRLAIFPSSPETKSIFCDRKKKSPNIDMTSSSRKNKKSTFQLSEKKSFQCPVLVVGWTSHVSIHRPSNG